MREMDYNLYTFLAPSYSLTRLLSLSLSLYSSSYDALALALTQFELTLLAVAHYY